MLTLKEALRTNRLEEFIKQAEAEGIGPADREKLDQALERGITSRAGFDFSFEAETEVNGAVLGGDTTIGQVELAVGILLSRHVFLTVSGIFGVTDDSPDVTLGLSLPVRF